MFYEILYETIVIEACAVYSLHCFNKPLVWNKMCCLHYSYVTVLFIHVLTVNFINTFYAISDNIDLPSDTTYIPNTLNTA